MITCGIIYPYNDLKDEEGCLKPDCHNDSHVFKDQEGKLIAWQEDEECNCGCWTEYENASCVIYREVKSINEKI